MGNALNLETYLSATMIYKGKKFDRRMGENEEWFAVYFN